MARPITFEVVQTDAGFHGRVRAGNHQPVWTTEVYTRRRPVLRAVELVAPGWLKSYTPVEVDERSGS